MDLSEKRKTVKVIGAAETRLAHLESHHDTKRDAQLLKSVTRTLDTLKADPFFGDSVQRKKIPHELQSLPNLFRCALSGSWRLLYYVTGDERQVIIVVFEICDHPTYDRIFGYRKK